MTITSKHRLLIFIVAAFIVDYLPIVNLPFLWSETFFHEISHGLAALITGGIIYKITLNFDGSGLCSTSGGIRFIVSFFGYAGSALWGLLIYSLASSVSKANAKYVVAVMVCILLVTLVLWARDMSTIVILIILLLMYTMQLASSRPVFVRWLSVKYFLQLVGVFVMLESVRSPLYLLDGRDLGDGATLSNVTGLPEIFWVGLWFVIALSCLYLLWTGSAKDRL